MRFSAPYERPASGTLPTGVARSLIDLYAPIRPVFLKHYVNRLYHFLVLVGLAMNNNLVLQLLRPMAERGLCGLQPEPGAYRAQRQLRQEKPPLMCAESRGR